MTGIEVAVSAQNLKNSYKYIYGAKGEYCTADHIEELIAESPLYFQDTQKAAAARQKAGYHCLDCSGFACLCSNYPQSWTGKLHDDAAEIRTLSLVDGNILAGNEVIPLGAILWKSGHVGVYIGGQYVAEAASELVDIVTNDIRQRDFTHALLLPGISYASYEGDPMIPVGAGSSYMPWEGKIVNTPSVIPQISPTNTASAAGIGMKSNGDRLTVIGQSGDYYQVKDQNGYTGYVYSAYIGAVSAAAYANEYTQWAGIAKSVNGYVNVRTGPGTSFPQNTRFPSINNYTEVTVLQEVLSTEDLRLWYQVSILDSETGYIRSDLLERKVVMDYSAWVGEAGSTTGTINIRTAPSVYSSLSSLHAPLSDGDLLTVIGETRGDDGMVWYQVRIDGIDAGYIRSDLVTMHVEDYYHEWDGVVSTPTSGVNVRTQPTTSAPVLTGSPFANGTVVHVIGETLGADGYTWYLLRIGHLAGYSRCDFIETLSTYSEWRVKAKTATGTLNIRSGAGTSYPQISGCPSVSNGDELKVTSQMCGTDGRVWYQVTVVKSSGSYQGYVRGDLTEPVNAASFPSWTGYANSINGTVNVRSQPTTASDLISGYPTLQNGDSVYVFGQEKGTDGYIWYHVRIGGLHIGYIRSDLLSHGRIITQPTGYKNWTGVAKGTNGTVNMRAAAGTAYDLVVSLQNGDTVEVINTTAGGDGYTWYQVERASHRGFIRSDLVIPPAQAVNENLINFTVSFEFDCPARGVAIRSGYIYREPNENTETVSACRIGDYFNLLKRVFTLKGTAWYKVQLDTFYGYVRAGCLKVFPYDNYCGGNNYEDILEHENLEYTGYGMIECQDCGWHKLYEKPSKIKTTGSLFSLSTSDIDNFIFTENNHEVVVSDVAISRDDFCSIIEMFEDALDDYNSHKNGGVLSNANIVNTIMGMARENGYDGASWGLSLSSEGYDHEFTDWLSTSDNQDYVYLYKLYKLLFNVHKSVSPIVVVEGNYSTDTFYDYFELKHFFATTQGYIQHAPLFPDYWFGWGGDLATLIEEVYNYSGSDRIGFALSMFGNVDTPSIGGSSFQYSDLISDVDAIGVANIIKSSSSDYNKNFVSDAIRDYYSNHIDDRKNNLLNDIKKGLDYDNDIISISNRLAFMEKRSGLQTTYTSNDSTDDVYTCLMLLTQNPFIGTAVIKETCIAMASYVLSESDDFRFV